MTALLWLLGVVAIGAGFTATVFVVLVYWLFRKVKFHG